MARERVLDRGSDHHGPDVYFRPWTLSEKVATEIVPYLAHLHRPTPFHREPRFRIIQQFQQEFQQEFPQRFQQEFQLEF